MTVVVKVGGSVLRDRDRCMAVAAALEDASATEAVVVLTGGGELADVVRDLDDRYGLSPETAHRAAIEAMMVNARVFAGCGDLFQFVETDIDAVDDDRVPVTGGRLLADRLPASWDVTSDSIAVALGRHLDASRTVLVKSVPGIMDDGRQILHLTPAAAQEYAGDVIDRAMPTLLEAADVPCIVVGDTPEQVTAAVTGAPVTGTVIESGDEEDR